METLVKGMQKLPEWARDTILGKIEIDRAWAPRRRAANGLAGGKVEGI